MNIQHLFQPFHIQFLHSDSCPMQTHKHSYYELIYIADGEGTHTIDGKAFRYYPDNLFLLAPMQVHYFDVERTTSFVFISFNNIYFEGQMVKDEHNHLGGWVRKLEYVFQNHRQNGCLIRNEPDKPLVRALIQGIISENDHPQHMQKELAQQLINTLITIVARNISLEFADVMRPDDGVALKMITYIHQHIYDAEKLKAENIAARFNVSINYISQYFKKQIGENLQQYIINYKMSLVEARLQYSDMRMHEIAFELGFTDESHLTRTFKKYKGITPTQYRKDLISAA